MEFSDEVLVERTLEGDDFAFCTLIKRHRGVVHGLCYHLVHNFADAEDLAQEAFIKAYFKLSSLSVPSKFIGWMRQITFNVCHDWLRHQKNDSVPLEVISNQPAISESPAEICEANELDEKVAKAISSLSEKNQQTVKLYYLDGRSCEEVANFMDVSVNVIQSRLYEARKQLKKELISVVKENLERHKLSQDFEEKVLKAIEQAKKAQSQYAYREVITYCDEALNALTELSDSVEHKKMKKEVLWLKGDAFNQHASRKEAVKYYEESLKLENEVGDKSAQANAFGEVARHYSNADEPEKAVEYYKRALDMFTELGDKAGQARILHWLGGRSINERNANIEAGISYYQRALDLFTEIGDKQYEASSRAGVDFLKHYSKQYKEISFEEGPSKIFFRGAVCETFNKSHDDVIYDGVSGTLGANMRIQGNELKDTFDAGPLRFLPDRIKILDFSLSMGDSWSMNVPSGGLDPMKITFTIQSNSEKVSVPAGEFSNCLMTKIVTSDEPKDCEEDRCGIREFIYAPGVGLVKSTFVRRDGAVGIAQLVSYTLSESNKDYFPLVLGNKWSYEWADKDGVFPSTDVYEVTGIENNHYYVSHYFLALKQL